MKTVVFSITLMIMITKKMNRLTLREITMMFNYFKLLVKVGMKCSLTCHVHEVESKIEFLHIRTPPCFQIEFLCEFQVSRVSLMQ